MELTVIIPIYNRPRMLAQALESLRRQTYKDFLVIICDDASKDNLKQVVDKFPDLNIQYHRYEANAGQFQNAMRGAELCQTPFIKYLYSDDLLFSTALEKQVKALKKEPLAAICLGGYIEFAEFLEQNQISLYNSIFPYIPQSRTKKQWAKLEEYAGFIPSACMYRAESFRNLGGFNTGLSGIADLEIYIALSSRYPVVAVDEFVCAMRMHNDQVTQGYSIRSDAIGMKNIFCLTSDGNPYRERLGIPLSQQFYLRLNECWVNLRVALSANQKLFFLKKWLGIVALNKMLVPFIFTFPFFAIIKILRKPKVQVGASNNLNIEQYKDYICSILFNQINQKSV